MKKYANTLTKTTLISALFLLFNCTSDSDEINQSTDSQIKSYKLMYMESPYYTNDLIYIDYIDNKPKKRTSDYSIVSGTTSTILVKQYEDISYNGNVINVVSKSLMDNTEITGTKEKITMNGSNIQQKIYYKTDFTRTSNYFYSGNKLNKIVSTQEGLYPGYLNYQKDFYYNTSNNLDSIVTKYSEYNTSTNQYELNLNTKKREVEYFYDYDNSTNTTKLLTIFDDVFNRTLSKNCFKKYRKNMYDENGNQNGFSTKHWEYIYVNDLIDYSK
ncbi:hypothetical protein [Chryseobacterium oryzae]|uniref:YD repeat-containing protein n=1 Tax=Chryseobacterium oryzae TaxID=2929799 RepID=A0ABY4BD87_9FLAO|nr:hypothetical protein [Chryseobacterium oryzae]UOE37035.1 hypothetical protein MTP08_08115 [Chryseobacterium oryzae]